MPCARPREQRAASGEREESRVLAFAFASFGSCFVDVVCGRLGLVLSYRAGGFSNTNKSAGSIIVSVTIGHRTSLFKWRSKVVVPLAGNTFVRRAKGSSTAIFVCVELVTGAVAGDYRGAIGDLKLLRADFVDIS